jgi:tripeptide aminopeptidase
MARLSASYLGVAVCAMLALAAPAAAQIVSPDISREVQTVRQVLATPEMKQAMDYVDSSDDETVQEWLSICNAYGPSMNETYRSRLLYKLFRIYGLDNVHIDDALNVIGVRKGVGGGPTVVLNAHHDNVALWPKDQPIEAFVADGRIWCPAAGDDLRGVVQLLSVLRAMNAGNIETKGDVWFTTFTGEEESSSGAEHFVRANYPLNLDWKKGDILIQFHGGAGDGVTSGSNNYIHSTQLRIFVPLDWPRWRTDAVDALAPIMSRINEELRDPRSLQIEERGTGSTVALAGDILYLNMSMIKGNNIINGTSNQAWVRIDLRSPSEERLWQVHRRIKQIADSVTRALGPGFSYTYEINMTEGTPGIEGFDKVNNEPTKVALAAAQVLYGGTATVDPTRGCGDCVRSFMGGMPMLSFRGQVTDYGEGGRYTREHTGALQSRVRRKTSGHDVTESAPIVSVWAGIKHGLLFAVSYAGLSSAAAAPGEK